MSRSATARSILRHSFDSVLPGLVSLQTAMFGAASAAWPLLDLLARLWLAQAYFVSGVLKLTQWDTALYLARHEYPVAWLDPVTAAWSGLAIEVVAPVFLAGGLATRYAAVPMGLLAAVAQAEYVANDTNLCWIAMCSWFAIKGAGPLSLDGLLRKGLRESALPLLPRLLEISEWMRTRGTPWALFTLRAWLGVALWPGLADSRWFLVASFSMLPASLALGAALSLLAGAGVRYVAAVLLLLLSAHGMMHERGALPLFALLLLMPLLMQGAGKLSIDGLCIRALRARYPALDGKPAFTLAGLPRVVIVGAGFGGLACAARLAGARVDVTLVDRTNFHLFQPLLYQVATAAVSPGDIAAPLRPLFREAFNVRVLLGSVDGIDTDRREVCVGALRLPYDTLVLATGATHSYFGSDHWAAHAPGLKRVEDATDIRRRLLLAFEQAEACDDEDERSALLTFLIVGGGPTGVELAGAIAELARHGMAKEFRRFDPARSRIVLLQSGSRILPAFDAALSAIATRDLNRLGVEVRTGSRVAHIDETGVTVGGEHIAARTVLWAAGVTASPAGRWLAARCDAAGRIEVDEHFGVPGFPGVYAVGDTAASRAWNGEPVPGLAPAAKQGGDHVAKTIRAAVAGRPPLSSFRYRHYGSLATIGRKSAVADFGRIKLWGAPAWWLWGLIHLGLLVGLRNRVTTLVNWFWIYLTKAGGIRLITGSESARGQ